ncbi:uncharacterized protein LOC144704419 [Wolffia australiana]
MIVSACFVSDLCNVRGGTFAMEQNWSGIFNRDFRAEWNALENGDHCSSPLKRTGDSVVYKLVRVESDGTLVPATDDDVMEVEHMLQDAGKDAPFIECKAKTQDYMADPGLFFPGKSDIHRLDESQLTGSSTASSQKRNARLQEKEKQEDQANSENLNIPVIASSSARLHTGMPGLDQLTIRQLQEAFRVVFGRPTSVKDKRWLRQRLSIMAQKGNSGEANSPPPPAGQSTLAYDTRARNQAKRQRKPTRRFIEESDNKPLGRKFQFSPCGGALVRRRWAPWEVSRLIDGVSKYGAGRWSQIRRLSFPSSCRSSVDLKDKWRNLLRASCFRERPGTRVGRS